MKRTAFLVVVLVMSLVGCSFDPPRISDPVPVKGKVSLAGGVPAKDVTINLQPMESGHPVAFKVAADGSFKGDVVPGKFVYFITATEGKAAAYKPIPEKYRSPDASNTVRVSSGTDLDIKLD